MLRLGELAARTLASRLRERGAPPSTARPGSPDEVESALVIEEYGPLCEVMYLVMVSDGEVAAAELDVLRGALRRLDEGVRSHHFAVMLKNAETHLAADGAEARLRAVARELAADPVRAEVAYALAAAVAWADDDVSTSENSLLEDLAEELGITEARSEELLRLLLE